MSKYQKKNKDPFVCSGCGACCRRVYNIPQFPEPIREDGSCSHLLPDNSCAIYDSRPLICQVDKFYDTHKLGIEDAAMSREEWHHVQHIHCLQFMKEDETEEKYKTPIEEAVKSFEETCTKKKKDVQ